MRRGDTAVEFICRVLYRSELVDIHLLRKYDDTARMLSGRSLNTDQSRSAAVQFCVRDRLTLCIANILHQSDRVLICKAADRTGPESMVLSEKFFNILMGSRLVFT